MLGKQPAIERAVQWSQQPVSRNHSAIGRFKRAPGSDATKRRASSSNQRAVSFAEKGSNSALFARAIHPVDNRGSLESGGRSMRRHPIEPRAPEGFDMSVQKSKILRSVLYRKVTTYTYTCSCSKLALRSTAMGGSLRPRLCGNVLGRDRGLGPTLFRHGMGGARSVGCRFTLAIVVFFVSRLRTRGPRAANHPRSEWYARTESKHDVAIRAVRKAAHRSRAEQPHSPAPRTAPIHHRAIAAFVGEYAVRASGQLDQAANGAAHSGVRIPAPVQQIHGAVQPGFQRERSGEMRNLRIRAELQVRAVHTRRGFGRRYLALIANRCVDHSGF